MKKTAKITAAQATNLEVMIAEYLVVKGTPNKYNVHFRMSKNYSTWADTVELCYYTQGGSVRQSKEILDGRQTNAVLRNCPVRVFETKRVSTLWGGEDLGEQMFLDLAALMLDPKGAEVVANAMALAKTTLSK